MKNKILLFAFCLGLFALSVHSCDKIYDPITVQGSVVDVDTSEPISNAIVEIISPEDIAAQTFSNESGLFMFEEVDVDSVIDITVQAHKEGYSTEMMTLLAAPEKELTIPEIRLKRTNGTDEDQDDSSTGSGGSSSITLESKSKDFIQVRGTGGDETVDFEFVVRDSSGVPITDDQSVYVRFQITSGPNGGESIYPDSARTQAGIARATLTSGTKAGAVQIRASFNRNGISSHSSPVPITISGGLPNDNHFEVSSEFKNIPARSSSPNEITVLLGDKHGNPVLPGTAVYFSTNKGNIDGSTNTDEQGYTASQLRTNNTSPGIATVKVETVDENSSTISRELDVLFSGDPQLSVSPTEVDLVGFQSQIFQVTLSDQNGNPLAEGTTMEVTVDNDDLTLSGTTFVELTDTQRKGNGFTEFEFRLRNPNNITITDNVTLALEVNGPNGQLLKELVFELEEAALGEPGSIYLDNISEESIGVRATGQKEDTQITFQVVDINGNPLRNDNAVTLNFEFGDSPQGGEFLSPESATTNNLGQATVTLTSGEKSGTVQVVARTQDSNGRTIRSQPVAVAIKAGLPSENNFSLHPAQRNMTYSQLGEVYEISALVGDKYTNTVPDGVSIYFESNGGTIDGSSTTINGRAVTSLQMGHPIPSNGLTTIRARTSNDEQNTIRTSTDVIFSGSPRITVNPSTFNLGNAEDQTFTIRVRDSNGYPMVEGTQINVTIEGDGLTIIGTTSFTLRDVNSDLSNIKDLTEFIINVRDSDPGNVTDDPVIMTIEVDGPNGYARHTIEGRKAKIR